MAESANERLFRTKVRPIMDKVMADLRNKQRRVELQAYGGLHQYGEGRAKEAEDYRHPRDRENDDRQDD